MMYRAFHADASPDNGMANSLKNANLYQIIIQDQSIDVQYNSRTN